MVLVIYIYIYRLWCRPWFRWELDLVLPYFLWNYFHSVHFNDVEIVRSISTDILYCFVDCWARLVVCGLREVK